MWNKNLKTNCKTCSCVFCFLFFFNQNLPKGQVSEDKQIVVTKKYKKKVKKQGKPIVMNINTVNKYV